MKMFRAILFVVLLRSAAFEGITNINILKQIYETNLHSSKQLDREDRVLMKTWMIDFQVKRVNVTIKYRIQMTRHKEHSFEKAEFNAKWTECVFLHRRKIRQHTREYYTDENECLTTTTIEDKNRTQAVEQLERESRKWRRSYRYLVKTCNLDNPGDEEAANMCLVQYDHIDMELKRKKLDFKKEPSKSVHPVDSSEMQKDNFNEVIQRLIILKQEAIGELYVQLNNSINELEACLKTQLSRYLEKLRETMDTLNKCYNMITRVN